MARKAKRAKRAVRSMLSGRGLNAVKFGLAGGIISAILMVLMSVAGMYGLFLNWMILFEDIYGFLGFGMSVVGVILGTIYAFVDGFVITGLLAWMYNKLL